MSETELGETLARLEGKLDRLLAAKGTPRVMLSMSEAARRLGVSRNDTLHELIATKQIRTVTVRGRTRIPLSEIERVQLEGA